MGEEDALIRELIPPSLVYYDRSQAFNPLGVVNYCVNPPRDIELLVNL